MPATTLNQQIQALATQVGSDVKTLIAKQGDLSTLTTSQKASLVLAINELNSAISQIDMSKVIEDGQTSADKTWSSNKILSEITTKCNEVKTALLGGAGDAYDTLKELADLITDNKELIDSLQELAGAHVRYDVAQELSPGQKTQARRNIGAADDGDYQSTKRAVGTIANLQTTEKSNVVGAVNEVLGIANTAKSTADTAKSTADTAKTTAEGAQQAAQTAQNEVDALETAIGPTDTDFVAIYVSSRDGTSEG
jgi:hypothetical protein